MASIKAELWSAREHERTAAATRQRQPSSLCERAPDVRLPPPHTQQSKKIHSINCYNLTYNNRAGAAATNQHTNRIWAYSFAQYKHVPRATQKLSFRKIYTHIHASSHARVTNKNPSGTVYLVSPSNPHDGITNRPALHMPVKHAHIQTKSATAALQAATNGNHGPTVHVTECACLFLCVFYHIGLSAVYFFVVVVFVSDSSGCNRHVFVRVLYHIRDRA